MAAVVLWQDRIIISEGLCIFRFLPPIKDATGVFLQLQMCWIDCCFPHRSHKMLTALFCEHLLCHENGLLRVINKTVNRMKHFSCQSILSYTIHVTLLPCYHVNVRSKRWTSELKVVFLMPVFLITCWANQWKVRWLTASLQKLLVCLCFIFGPIKHCQTNLKGEEEVPHRGIKY